MSPRMCWPQLPRNVTGAGGDSPDLAGHGGRLRIAGVAADYAWTASGIDGLGLPGSVVHSSKGGGLDILPVTPVLALAAIADARTWPNSSEFFYKTGLKARLMFVFYK